METKLRVAEKTKKACIAKLSNGRGLEAMIENDSNWSWARHVENQGKLRQLLAEADKASNEFITSWLVHDSSSLKTLFDQTTIMCELSKSVPIYEKAVEAVSSQAEGLKRMMRAWAAQARQARIVVCHEIFGKMPNNRRTSRNDGHEIP